MIIHCIDEEDIDYLDSIIEDKIDQYVEFIDIVDEIVEENEDIDIYWEDSIEIGIDEVVVVSSIIELWDSDDSIKRDDWLRSSSSW